MKFMHCRYGGHSTTFSQIPNSQYKLFVFFAEFEEAKLLYEKIEYIERVLECTRYIDESHTWIALREEATELRNEAEKTLGRADGTFRTADFEEARSLFEHARIAWEEYDDQGKAAACEEKITICNAEIARINRNRLIVTGVIIGALGVIVQAVRHRQLKHKETNEVMNT